MSIGRLLPPRATGEVPPQAPHPPVAAPVRAEEGTSLTRRLLLRALTVLGSVGATAAALSPIVRAGDDGKQATGPEGERALYGMFDEVYRGRHIRGGILLDGDRAGRERGEVMVLIDGRSLHVMRRADGSYMSALHHFESFATPQDAARAAVDALGESAQLA